MIALLDAQLFFNLLKPLLRSGEALTVAKQESCGKPFRSEQSLA